MGIQASQLLAIARWLKTPVTIESFGPRTSLIAAVARALDPRSVATVQTHEPLTSLKEILEKNLTADKYPEFFCFGLLESFDLPK